MMKQTTNNPLDFIEIELNEIRDKSLYRKLRSLTLSSPVKGKLNGKPVTLFCSNDYLGLTFDEDIKNIFKKTIQEEGVGSGAARLISGGRASHQELENELASFLGKESALLYSSGYLANLGVLSSLFTEGDLIVFDKLSHASLIDAAKLSEADYRVYPHKNLDRLDAILAGHRSKGQKAIVTDSVFSMDGDTAPLEELIEIKEKHNAFLILDEAHGFGVFGAAGRGAAENVLNKIDVYIGTLSKAAGLVGGFVSGDNKLIDYLINKSRTFIYDTALPPGISAAARVSLEKIKEGGLRAKLWKNVKAMRGVIEDLGFNVSNEPSPIIPIIIGREEEAVAFSNELLEKGFFIPAVRFPTVSKGQARLRMTVSAAHSEEDIKKFGEALKDLKAVSG